MLVLAFDRTLIFEDLNYKHPDGRIYGWTAQYNVLRPTKSSLGAADYVDIEYWKERDKMRADVDCHVPLFDAPKVTFNGFHKGPVPNLNERIRTPSKSHFQFSLAGE